MLLSGPPNQLNMEGFSQGKGWLQNYIGETAEIRGGDYPLPHTDEISASVLIAGIKEVPRLGLNLNGPKRKRS